MTRIYGSAMISILTATLAGGCSIYFDDGQGQRSAGAEESETGVAEVRDEPGGQCATVPRGDVILDCAENLGYQVHSWRASAAPSPGLHLVSVYETLDRDFQQHPEGQAHVTFDLPGSHVLALSAYEPTHWVVDVAPGSRLDAIVVFGYHEQEVSAPAAVPVEIHDMTTGGGFQACGYSLPYNGGGCDTGALIADVEAVTALELSSFHGCYLASEFVLTNNSGECRD